LVFLVNDSEYSRSTDAKSILSLSCIYLVSPGARLARCCAPHPTPPPFLGEGKVPKKPKKKIVGVGVVAAFVLLERLVC